MLGRGLRQIRVAQFENHRRRADLVVGRPQRAGLGALALHLAALVEVVLNPGVGGVIGDEVELVPEPVQLLLALLVENQFHQRGVVAPVAHHVVIAGAQQAALVLRIVGEEAAALLDVEGVGENGSEARERRFIAGALGGRNHQIGIARRGPSA